MKRILLKLLAMLVLTFIVVSCDSNNSPKRGKPEAKGESIRVACYNWPGTYWIEIADRKGWFAEAGLEVELIDTNPNYFQSLQDMIDGKMDAAGFSLFDVIRFNAAGADLVLVINCDNSHGSEVIVAREEINSLGRIKGKKVGVDTGSYTDYILSVALNNYGLTDNDITRVPLSGELVTGKITQGLVDAVITWEPHLTKILEKENCRRIFDTSEISGISPNGQVFKRSFIKQRQGDVQAYVNVWHRTTRFIRENPEEAFGIIAGIYGMKLEEVIAFTQAEKILNLDENITAFSYGASFESLHGAARKMTNFMINKEIMYKRLDSTTFIDGQFIRNLKQHRQ